MLENIVENAVNNVLGDYYRGGTSYEDSVKNRLNALEATGIATTLAVSNMNSGLTDAINSTTNEIQGLRNDLQSTAVGLYNQGQRIRNDIQSMATGITSAIQESTYTLVASQQMLIKSFQHGFNSIANTLDFGFGLVGNKIDVLSEEVSSKLDQIQDIINNPRLTQSRELYRQALISYKKGFYEEALEDCIGAVEKNKTDYISWYLLGLIYLYGAGENSNVINLDKAEEAFANAAKYIKPDITKSNEAQSLASEIYYNLGFSRLAKSNDYLIENKLDDSNTKLLEAESASNMAYNLSKKNLLAGYEQAKSLHFLGKDDECLKLLEELIRTEKNYAIKVFNDKNFESLKNEIEKLINKLKLEVCKIITADVESCMTGISSEIEYAHNSIIAEAQNVTLQNKEVIINKALELKKENIELLNSKTERNNAKYNDIKQKDYFTVLDAQNGLSSDLETIKTFVDNLISNTKKIIKREIEKQQKLEEEEYKRQEEERKRQEEEQWRQERERRQQKLKEEEERKRKEAEEWKRKREEKKRKKERLWRRIVLLVFIGFQCGLIMCTKYLEVSWIKDNELNINSQSLSVLAGLFSFIGLLFANGIFSYMISDERQTNLLFKAIKKCDVENVEKVEKYINKGANVNAKKGKSGSTPLFYMLNSIRPAVDEGYNEIYEDFFIELGDCKTYNVYKNIKHYALERDKVPFQIFDLLINAGADINIANNYGVTPLMLSSYFLARCTNEETDHQIFICIEKMLDLGADVNAKTKSGITALQINEYGHDYLSKDKKNEASNMRYKQKVIDLLRKNGAKE